MQTPYLPQAIFSQDFQNVYEPAEDTFLLLDALEKDLDTLKTRAQVCLECGSGSGTIITALAKALCNTQQPRVMLATDINGVACKTTQKCAKYHGREDVAVIQTDLAEALVDRLENQVDLLVFNPPYVPTDEDESVESRALQLAWAGGHTGTKLIDKFLSFYVPRLMSKPNGVAYLVALDKNDIVTLSNYLVNEHHITGTVAMERRAGMEHLFVVKYQWIK